MALLSLLRRLCALVVSTVGGLARPQKMPGLEELLQRAGVPRTASPELLAVARLADLRLEDDDDDDNDSDDDDDDSDDDDDNDSDDDDDDSRVGKDDDWKSKSRKNETRAKKAERRAKEAEEKLKKRENADKSDGEKALEKAKKEGREEASTEAQKGRREDRLEVAVTRLAARKIKVGSGDEAKEHRFADTEDALMHIERAIAKGEIDDEDIFDDEGRVKTDALEKELAELLSRKPHLRDGGSEGSGESKGDPDLRKGDPANGDLEAMSPEDHAKRKYGKKD